MACINPYIQGIDTITTTTTTGEGLWGQLNKTSIEDPWEERLKLLEEEMAVLRINLKLSRLKILALEGKFTQEEIANIRKMIMSKDEASITLADTIIDNA